MTVIAEISSYDQASRDLSMEGLEKLKIVFPKANKSEPGGYLYGAEGTVDLDLLLEVCGELGLHFIVKPYPGNVFFAKSRTRGIEKRLEGLETDFELLKETEGRGIIQMHAPNFALLTFNRVKLLENACTDQLQDHLTDGWRMLAVCPPLDERRPTYILGRYVQE